MLALVACGGGGGDSSKFETPPGVVGPGGTTSVQMGNGTGSSFQSGILGVSSATLSAGGSTTLTAVLQQSDGSLYAQPATVTFNSPCVANNQAAIQPAAAAATTTGIATVTYVAKGCSGSDTITATTTIGSASLSATGSVTVAQGSVGAIAFVSATPSNIALKGTGDAGRPESSTVVFKVLDSAGGPRAGANVSFSLNTSVGGMTLTPATATATSDALGQVQIVVNAGTVATSVKVTATVKDTTPQITTQSSQLTVTTGIPTANNMSLAVGCYNIEGWDYDGIQTTVTARLADRFQNPVPDGTAVTFHAKGGKIGAQCTTATDDVEGAVCSVNFTSQEFRPPNGRVPLLATAIGEESFTDSNGNGAFDATEAFNDSSEPFEDDAETGAYAANDYFVDFNNNGSFDGPNGSFNGVLCNDAARCGGAKSAGIGARNIIILSGSSPTIDVVDGSDVVFAPPVTAGTSFKLWVRDLHGNPMPATTTVSLAVVGNGAATFAVAAPATYTVPCSAAPVNAKTAATVFPFTVTSPSPNGSTGVVTVTVKTPKLQTTQTFGVKVGP